jgi:hypothetical protein
MKSEETGAVEVVTDRCEQPDAESTTPAYSQMKRKKAEVSNHILPNAKYAHLTGTVKEM